MTLRVGNKNRPIRSLQFIRVATDMVGAASAPVTPVEPLPPAFATNMVTVADLPRSIVLVVDDESMPIGQEEKLRSALTNFVRDLPPRDNVALVTVPHGGLMVGTHHGPRIAAPGDREHQSHQADRAGDLPHARDAADAREHRRAFWPEPVRQPVIVGVPVGVAHGP